MKKDLFGNIIYEKPVEINIYCDEIQPISDPYTRDEWFYIGMIVEDLSNPLLDDIISERFKGNSDERSHYYLKNNHVIHWAEINNADKKNICERWFKYILNPARSGKKFYSYILGINNSKLCKESFDPNNEFNSKYNRFFRSAVLYALKTFFPNKKIIVKNLFHEEGPQQLHKYFPWHCIYVLNNKDENIYFEAKSIIFLPKDHKKDKRSNLIQLCDAFMGACVKVIHGLKKSNKSKYKEELLDLISPLVVKMVDEPYNTSSQYQHANRIIIRFFPSDKSSSCDSKGLPNQFYTRRKLSYVESQSGQGQLFKNI